MAFPLRNHWLPDELLEVSVMVALSQSAVEPPGVIVGAGGPLVTLTEM
jgi:hypothetical protein